MVQLAPFGPQTQWSILLHRREVLLEEIEHSLECLARLSRDWPVSNSGAQGGPQRPKSARGRASLPETPPAPQRDHLDALFRTWLARLESELEATTRKLQALAGFNEAAIEEAEQSIFALQRAAG